MVPSSVGSSVGWHRERTGWEKKPHGPGRPGRLGFGLGNYTRVLNSDTGKQSPESQDLCGGQTEDLRPRWGGWSESGKVSQARGQSTQC